MSDYMALELGETRIVRFVETDDVVYLELSGTIGDENTEQIRSLFTRLHKESTKSVVLDLRAVSHIWPKALEWFPILQHWLEQSNRALSLNNLDSMLRQVFDMMGMSQFVHFTEDIY